jgi:hypothetical protein
MRALACLLRKSELQHGTAWCGGVLMRCRVQGSAFLTDSGGIACWECFASGIGGSISICMLVGGSGICLVRRPRNHQRQGLGDPRMYVPKMCFEYEGCWHSVPVIMRTSSPSKRCPKKNTGSCCVIQTVDPVCNTCHFSSDEFRRALLFSIAQQKSGSILRPTPNTIFLKFSLFSSLRDPSFLRPHAINTDSWFRK